MSYFDDNEDRIIYGRGGRKAYKTPAPLCPECGHQAERVTGTDIYPDQEHLHHMLFYQCLPCDTRVGLNPRTGRPHGSLAGPELRRARQRAHRAFDPMWKSGGVTRSEAYAWLARQMGLPILECHIGMFDEEQCGQVVALSVADDFEDCT